MITGKGKITCKEVHSKFSFQRKTFTFSILALKKYKKTKKIKSFYERIFLFLRDILGNPNSFRYFSSSEPVYYNFLVSFQMIIQIFHPFGMQGSYHRKEKKNFYVRWGYAFFELFCNFICHPSVALFRNICLCSFVDAWV